MHVLCFIDTLGSGGAQRQLVMLGKLLRRHNHAVSFLTYHRHDFFARELEECGIQVHCVDISNPIKRLLAIRRFLQQGSQHVVLSFLESPNLIAEIAALPHRKWGLVVSERSANATGILSRNGRMKRIFHNVADAIITNSAATRDILQAHWPALTRKLHTIYNAVDLLTFSPPESYVPRSQQYCRIVVAASYQDNKNMQRLITAVANLTVDEQQMLRIDWYGQQNVSPGKTRAYLAAQQAVDAHDLNGIISLHPETSEIRSKMQSADVVALVSCYEGLPNAICEGMACGKAILLSRVSDANYLVEDGVNGWLCDPLEIDSISDGLRKIIRTTPEELIAMGQRSRERAEALFSPEQYYQHYMEIFERFQNGAGNDRQ